MSAKNKKPQKKTASEDSVLSRARRMMRSETKKWAAALGLESADPETLEKELAKLKANREKGLSETEVSTRRIKELEDKLAQATAKLHAATTESRRLQKELANSKQELENRTTEYEIRELASRTGIRDTDYAVHLLRQHVRSLPDGQDDLGSDQISAYFEGLKKQRPHLFAGTGGEDRVPAGPPSLAEQQQARTTAPTTAPGGSAVPPQAAPAPSNGAKPAEDTNVLDMKKQDFNRYARDRYGFNPGVG